MKSQQQGEGRVVRVIALCVAATTALLLVGCSSLPQEKDTASMTVDDVGTVRAAVISVAPWQSYVDVLQPHFSMSIKDALKSSIATTRRSSLQRLNDTSIGLDVGQVAGTTNTTTETKNSTTTKSDVDAEGKETSSTENTNEVTSKENPAAPTQENSTAKLTPKEVAGDIAIDPRLHYQAATALYQEIQVLDRYVKDAVKKKGYTPFLVRLQFTVMPKQHDLPLDAYITLSFFSNNGLGGSSPSVNKHVNNIDIIPLISNSNYESSMSSAVLQQIQDLRLAIQSLSASASNAKIGNLKEQIDSALARDINNTFIVARMTDNTIRVKIGALQQLSSRYSMVPRIEYATVMMLVPNEDLNVPVQVNTYSDIVNTSTGQTLKTKLNATEHKDIEGILYDYFKVNLHASFPEEDGVAAGADSYKEGEEYINNLWRYMRMNDYGDFHRILDSTVCDAPEPDIVGERYSVEFENIIHGNDINLQDYCDGNTYIWTRELWAELAHLQPGYVTDVLSFELPAKTQPQIFPPQTVFLNDDGKSQSKVTLYNGQFLRQDEVCAVLVAHGTAVNPVIIPATAVSISSDGMTGTLTFPSLKNLGVNQLKNEEAKDGKAADVKQPTDCRHLDVQLRTAWSESGRNDCWNKHLMISAREAKNVRFSSQGIQYCLLENKKPQTPKLGYQLKPSGQYVVINDKGDGRLGLLLIPEQNGEDKELKFLINGGVLASVTCTDKDIVLERTGNLLSLTLPKEKKTFNLELNFSGLAEDEDITIDMRNGNKDAKAEEIKFRTRSIAKPREKAK